MHSSHLTNVSEPYNCTKEGGDVRVIKREKTRSLDLSRVHRHFQKKFDRQTDRQTGRQTDRQIDRKISKMTSKLVVSSLHHYSASLIFNNVKNAKNAYKRTL